MPVVLWLVFGAIFWLSGYLASNDSTNQSDIPWLNQKTVVPKLIHIVFGMPKSNTLPNRLMSNARVVSQLIGMSMILYGLLFHQNWPVTDPNLSSIIGWCCSIILGYAVTYLLHKKYHYP